MQETMPFSASKGDTFSFHTCETCSTQEHKLIAQRSRNKANIEMHSTVQSVVVSLRLPTFLKSEHWSQQNTVLFSFLFFSLLLGLSCQTFCIPNAGCVKQHPAGISEKHQCTQPQETLSNISIVCSVMRDEETKSKNSREQKALHSFQYHDAGAAVSVFWNLYTL